VAVAAIPVPAKTDLGFIYCTKKGPVWPVFFVVATQVS
jgi:hypothetical protein